MQALPVRICYCSEVARELYESGGGLAPATTGSAGLDLRACFDAPAHTIPPGGRLWVPTGVAVQPLPHTGMSVAGFVYSRSGLGAQRGLVVAQGVGVIDADYRGEISVVLLNTSAEEHALARGERMAQIIFQPICAVTVAVATTLDATERGAGGFGHTGRVYGTCTR